MDSKEESASQATQSASAPIIEARELAFQFGKEAGVFDLNFQVPRGLIFGLVGPSGCGKTTTVRLLNGMYKPDRGSVKVLGEAPHDFSAAALESIGYMPQHFVLYPMLTVAENLNFVASLYGMPVFRQGRVKSVLKLVELYDVRHRLAGALSGGMQRRLQLACALIHDPQLIFADEPTTGIDPLLRGKFWEHFRLLRDEGHTLFITTQYVSDVEQCDIVAIMRSGRLLYIDTAEALRRRAFGGDIVRLEVDPNQALAAVQLLNEQPIVRDAHRAFGQMGLILVSTDDAASAMPKLVALLQDRSIPVRQAERYAPPFDEVFIELTKQSGERNA